jgi:hypothetical protein
MSSGPLVPRFVPVALAAIASLGAAACEKSSSDVPLSGLGPDEVPNVPVPPADGPKLAVLRDGVAVVERPAAGARMLGELRSGALVSRSATPYGKSGCEGGWYAVRPRGFVCAGEAASVELPAGRTLPAPPRLDRALPYRYGRMRTDSVPVYGRVPTPAEQLAAETDLGRWLPGRAEADSEPLGAAANDVPVDARAVASGPPVLLAGGDGVDAAGRRTALSFFTFPHDISAAALVAQSNEVKVASLRKNSGIAITGTFSAPGPSGPRRFGLMPDGRIVATDRLRPALGSTWSGIDLEKAGLPVAFVHKSSGVFYHALHKGKATPKDEELERRTAIPMSGKFRTVGGVRFEQTKDGEWLRSQDIVVVVRRSKWPEFAVGKQKWVDISLANQTLTAYEGRKPIYATLVSSGRDCIGDPQTTASTVRGAFRVRSKHISRAIDNREVYQSYDVADAPWVIEFEPGYAITASYWNDPVGEAQNYHNVTLSPVDARRIWSWADPQVPEGWHGVLDTGAETTMVNVRP